MLGTGKREGVAYMQDREATSFQDWAGEMVYESGTFPAFWRTSSINGCFSSQHPFLVAHNSKEINSHLWPTLMHACLHAYTQKHIN